MGRAECGGVAVWLGVRNLLLRTIRTTALSPVKPPVVVHRRPCAPNPSHRPAQEPQGRV